MKKIAFAPWLLSIFILTGCELNSQPLYKTNQYNLEQLIANKSCNASFQCKVIGVGERAVCGGPRKYEIYSTLNSDEVAVEAAASKLKEDEKKVANEASTLDACQPVLPVQALCLESICQPITIK